MRAQTYIHISDLVIKSAKTLDERLADLLTIKGGRDLDLCDLQIFDIHNSNGFSGHNYWVDDTLIGQLQIGSLTSGNYVIYKRVYLEGEINEIYDYYDVDGNFSYSAKTLDCGLVNYSSINMEPLSPFINHLYNIINNEYDKAKTGNSMTARIVLIEGLLNKYYKDPDLTLSIDKGNKDDAVVNIENEIYRIEADPVLTWTERQNIYASLKEVRSKIIETKKRVHKLSSLKYSLPILSKDVVIKLARIKARPFSNLKGLTYKWTLGKFFWFISTVKENLGYSVALAIYGPFTFYFITQPMNPHAMWAVGKVRNAYLSVVNSVESVTTPEITYENTEKLAEVVETQKVQDQVSTGQSAVSSAKSTSIVPLEKISWDQRMTNFKAMQIAYESDLVFAARMGRLEQMETQFNFPLTAESAYAETKRYLRKVKSDLEFFKNLDIRYRTFLQKEVTRTQEVQVYIWKKMAQFFLDHPYMSVDEQNEQKERDYYVGRAFVFMDDLTTELSKKNLSQTPLTHDKVKALAKFYRQSKVRRASVMKNLKSNSKLFASNDLFDTDSFRGYMKDHWEVLFLQQNKKQEASSFALQTYNWSIKNALWTLQSIYSAKREDINSMTYKFNLDNKGTSAITSNGETDELLEAMMHMLTIEYVSIKKEFQKNMKNDEEAVLRERLINNAKNYLSERDKLFNSTIQVAGTNDRATKQI